MTPAQAIGVVLTFIISMALYAVFGDEYPTEIEDK